MATHPSILAWEIPWTEEPGTLQWMGLRKSGTTELTHTHTHKKLKSVQSVPKASSFVRRVNG